MERENKTWPIWAINKIKRLESISRKQEDYLYKHTIDTIHEDQKHCNKTITELIDICLKEMPKSENLPTVTAFKDAGIMRSITIDALNGNIKKIIGWSGKINNTNERLNIKSDIMDYDIGHGIIWKNNKMTYVKAKSAVIVLRRHSNDPNEIDFRRITTYLNLHKDKTYPDAVTLYENFDLVPYMLRTKAYKNAKTDAERQKLLSYVQRPNNNQQPFEYQKDIPMDSDFSERNIESSPAIDQYVNQQKSFENIQRNIGDTQTDKRHVNLNQQKMNLTTNTMSTTKHDTQGSDHRDILAD